ncbi:MAG: DNA double-strand break repair nuclease NurA [Candidatus Njordarchaeia archaeon]
MRAEESFGNRFTSNFIIFDTGDVDKVVKKLPFYFRNLLKDNRLFKDEALQGLWEKSRDSGDIEFLEDELLFPVSLGKPHEVLNNMNIVGVDGSSVVFRGHPFRLIIARSAVYTHSQKLVNVLRLYGLYKSTLRIVDEYPLFFDIDDVLRRFESETLSFIESETIIDIGKKFGSDYVDLIVHDGPLYFPNGTSYTENMLRVLYELDIPIVGIVKNSFSRLIVDIIGGGFYLDSDFFSFHLKENFRTSFFLNNKVGLVDDRDLRVVSAYYMTPKKNLLRIDVPLWVFEQLGPEKIMEIIVADIAIGGGSYSYVLGKADKIAKFSEFERGRLLSYLKLVIHGLGFHEDKFYNHVRWGLYGLRKRGL